MTNSSLDSCDSVRDFYSAGGASQLSSGSSQTQVPDPTSSSLIETMDVDALKHSPRPAYLHPSRILNDGTPTSIHAQTAKPSLDHHALAPENVVPFISLSVFNLRSLQITSPTFLDVSDYDDVEMFSFAPGMGKYTSVSERSYT